MACRWPYLRGHQVGTRSQTSLQTSGVGLPPGIPTVQFGQLSKANCGVNIRPAIVKAEFLVKIALFHAVVAQNPAFFSDSLAIGRDHAAFTAGHVFSRVKRKPI